MKNSETNNGNLHVDGQDFANTERELNGKPSSHGEAANQRHGDFTELEESRMDNPPNDRETNGSKKNDIERNNDSDRQRGAN